jgi:uncharacterized membrane protein
MFMEFVNSASARLAALLTVFAFTSGIFWLYFSPTLLLIVGLVKILKDELPHVRGLDKVMPFGRLFYAMPLAVFGTEHLTNTAAIAQGVPRWLPFHLFWAYLVGIALIAAALSITIQVKSRLAAMLLGPMFLCFVLLIHVPNIIAQPHDRIVWAVALRDMTFSGGALAYAGSHTRGSRKPRLPRLVTIARFFIAIPALFFGVENFLHPQYAPGVPLGKITPEWIPARLPWAYLAGTLLLLAGIALVINKKSRLAATYLGVVMLLLVFFVYLPLLIATPTDLLSLNYVFDSLLFSGAILLLADALPEQTAPAAAVQHRL